ncbi:fimbrial protein [Pseudomonas mucidolens]|nr:fimbrial protein [Pseudomonas mucidolens]
MKVLMSKSKLWFYATVFGVFALSSSALKAECTISKEPVTFIVNVPSTLNIPRDTPIGTEVYRSPLIALPGSPSFTCGNYDYSFSGYNSVGGTPASGPSPLGTSGLAWQMVANGFLQSPYPKSTAYTGTFNIKNAGIRIYKIGEVDFTALDSGTLGAFLIGGKPLFYLATSNAITPAVSSCTTPSINVPLGKQYSSKFKGVGSTIGEKTFSIQLNNCPAGINSISYRLDPVNTALDARNGILALDPGGATGVGIKVTDSNGAPVGLGQTFNFLKNVSAGNYNIPLKAAYYKTSDTVVGGAANASMQFTITYQ